jgi:superfamily II DNA or RNA helicase
MRRFATKRQRNFLWRVSDGLCTSCGGLIDHSFHADHQIPWSQTHETNVQQMQALCARCNILKGASVLRSHQAKFEAVIRQIALGSPITEVMSSVTPGGGKSLLPVIAAAHLIRARVVDKICWIVPRTNLAVQGAKEFLETWSRNFLRHTLEIRESTNELDPSRGSAGYVTTYAAIGVDGADVNIGEFSKYRYALILDEIHHVAEGGVWHRAIRPLYDKAAIRILMTGSLTRSDGQKIAFLPYVDPANGKSLVDLISTDTRHVIRYSLKEGLDERVIIPMYFDLMDGEAKWLDRDNNEDSVESLAEAGIKTSDALYTALNSAYADHLLRGAVEHWKTYKAERNRRSKLLVVAPSQGLARRYLSRLVAMGVNAGIATSDESESAKDEIQRLKGEHRNLPARDALVTVAMAYEGMDCKSITHIACLTHIRAAPWIEQMLARATRYDPEAGDWNEQAAYIFAPDDKLFLSCIEEIRQAQAPFVREILRKEDPGPDRNPPGPIERETVVPLSGSVTQTRGYGFENHEFVDAAKYELAVRCADQVGMRGYSGVQIWALYDQLSLVQKDAPLEAPQPVSRPLTKKEREEELKANIKKFINGKCQGDGDLIRQVNGYLISTFNKPRGVLTEHQLQQVWENRETWIATALRGRQIEGFI